MKPLLKRLLVLFMMLSAVFVALPTTALAANQRTLTVSRSVKGTSNRSQVKAVKKGKTRITYKKGNGWVKFTATKSKYYKFKFYNTASKYKGVKSQTSTVGIYYCVKNWSRTTSKKIKYTTGKTYSEKAYLKKGQHALISYYGHTNYDGDYVKTTVTLEII